MTPPVRDRDEITYAFCGIPDPAAFYAGKQQGMAVPVAADIVADAQIAHTILWTKHLWLARAVGSVARRLGRPVNVLEYGCGYGSLGLLTSLVPCELHGVDYNADARERVLGAGYASFTAGDFQSADLAAHGPFDVICSLDVYGHVEFRHKDALLERWRSLLAPGGALIEGVETGTFDYFCEPGERYAFAAVDGHIGLESWQDILARYRRHFAHADGQCRYGLSVDSYEIVKQSRAYGNTAYDEWATLVETFDDGERHVFDLTQGLVFWALTDAWQPDWDRVGGFGFVVASDESLGDVPGPWPDTLPGFDPVAFRRSLTLGAAGAMDLSLAFAARRTAEAGVARSPAEMLGLAPPPTSWVADKLAARAADPDAPLDPPPSLPRRIWSAVPESVRASAPVAKLRRTVARRRS